MKKLLLPLFLLIFITSFSWEVIEQVNEFREKTGSTILKQNSKNNKGIFIITKDPEIKYTISLATGDYIVGKGPLNNSNVKFKLDNNEIIELKGAVISGKMILFFDEKPKIPELIEKMKNSNNIKVVAENSNGSNSFAEYDINGLKEMLQQIK